MNPADMDPRRIETLRAIMKALRNPKTGCPWDLEQSFETIAPYTIEEAYEVADAIARGDRADLCQELGDLLLQPVYHAELAEEEGAFGFDDVVEAVCRKMIRRHPHVFGDEEARSARLAKGFWEDSKAGEAKDDGGSRRTLEGIPVALPGLTRLGSTGRRQITSMTKSPRKSQSCATPATRNGQANLATFCSHLPISLAIGVSIPRGPSEPPTRSSNADFAISRTS